MIKSIVLSLLIVTSAYAGDAPEMTVQSAEQAVTCFQKARDSGLRDSLSERQRDTLTSACQMSGLRIRLLHPADFQTLHPADFKIYLKDPLAGEDVPLLRFVGTFATAASSKNPTWYLDYSEFNHGHLMVYLDAVTGKILYLCVVPEG